MLAKKEIEIDSMPIQDVVDELKSLAIPTYGTTAERKEWLKKHYGMYVRDVWPFSDPGN